MSQMHGFRLTSQIARCVIVALLLPMITAFAADAPVDGFEKLFGAEAKKVAATPLATDDTALAEKLLKSAESLKQDVSTRTRVLEKAYEFGLAEPPGYATALKAVKELQADSAKPANGAESTPADAVILGPADAEEKSIELNEKLLKVYDLQWRKGKPAERAEAGRQLFFTYLMVGDARLREGKSDEAMRVYKHAQEVVGKDKSLKDTVQLRLRRVAAREQSLKKSEKLQTRLDAKPDDGVLRTELVLVRLFELEDPAGAVKTLGAAVDADTRRWVPKLAEGIDKVPTTDLISLAEWLVKMAGSLKADAKATALLQASQIVEQFLTAHETEDAERLHATQMKSAISKQLDGQSDSARRVDLLQLIDLKRDAISTAWKLKNGVLSSETPDFAYLELPYVPPDEYDLEIVFTRVSGSGSIGPFCYSHEKMFRWLWGVVGHDDVAGIAFIDGKFVGDKNASTITDIPNTIGQSYKTVYKIRRDRVEVMWDGKTVANFKTNYGNLNEESKMLRSRPALGLFTYRSTVKFESVVVYSVSGKGQVRQ